MVVCVDFDGTVVSHEYPKIGNDIGAEPVLKDLVKSGHKLILYTMRDGSDLGDAVNWFFVRGIELWSVNVNPQQKAWTQSPKAYAELYIDDAALGVPLTIGQHKRPYVDWIRVRELLNDMGVI